MTDVIFKTLWMYGLAIAVSMTIAVVIKVIVVVLNAIERKPEEAAPRAPSAAAPALGIPPEHVAAIAAAIHAAVGAHRILHIEDKRRGTGWVGEGRLAHHVSHVVRSHHPKR